MKLDIWYLVGRMRMDVDDNESIWLVLLFGIIWLVLHGYDTVLLIGWWWWWLRWGVTACRAGGQEWMAVEVEVVSFFPFYCRFG